MNTKRELGSLILIGSLALATWAFAQTTFKADGIIQSTQGGFKFPNESIQTTAYSSSIEVYGETATWSGNDTDFSCNFAVPDGKILMIEHVSGYHQGEGEHQALAYMNFQTSVAAGYLIPNVADGEDANGVKNFIFEAKNVGYAESGGFFIKGNMPLSGSNVIFAWCAVTGRLFDAPET